MDLIPILKRGLKSVSIVLKVIISYQETAQEHAPHLIFTMALLDLAEVLSI